MKAKELQELGVEGTLTRVKAKKLKAQLGEQVVTYLSLNVYEKIDWFTSYESFSHTVSLKFLRCNNNTLIRIIFLVYVDIKTC